jgi:hypothetical protein
VFTIYATCNVISHVIYFVLLQYYYYYYYYYSVQYVIFLAVTLILTCEVRRARWTIQVDYKQPCAQRLLYLLQSRWHWSSNLSIVCCIALHKGVRVSVKSTSSCAPYRDTVGCRNNCTAYSQSSVWRQVGTRMVPQCNNVTWKDLSLWLESLNVFFSFFHYNAAIKASFSFTQKLIVTTWLLLPDCYYSHPFRVLSPTLYSLLW